MASSSVRVERALGDGDGRVMVELKTARLHLQLNVDAVGNVTFWIPLHGRFDLE